jgi:hypothetical protein
MAWTNENTSAAVAGGSGVIGGLLQFFGAKKQQQRIFDQQEKMYATQRADALADWQMQNAYNSPEQQMQRLKDAGLNPNLVYGNGATATSNQEVRSSDPGSPQAVNTMAGLGQSIASLGMGYIDMKAKTAQTDNIRAQNELIQEQVRSQKLDNASKSLTYIMDAAAKNASNDATARTAVKKALQEVYNLGATGDVLDAQSGNIQTDTNNKHKQGLLIGQQITTENLRQKIMQDENDRAWIMNASNVREAAARITSMAVANARSEAERQKIMRETTGKEYENIVKRFEAEMSQQGVKPGDSYWQRKIAELQNSILKGYSVGDTLYKN